MKRRPWLQFIWILMAASLLAAAVGTADYAFMFVTKGGLPFVGTMAISDTNAEGKTTAWALMLDKISFTRPAKRP